nr:immunoglobulin light chain junction region [Macaca mulatta]MOW65831.1 immunoglobulin light chain junction region [Macaca mulatta]
CLQDMEYPLTF